MVAITAKLCQRTAPSRWPGGGPMAAAVYAHRLPGCSVVDDGR